MCLWIIFLYFEREKLKLFLAALLYIYGEGKKFFLWINAEEKIGRNLIPFPLYFKINFALVRRKGINRDSEGTAIQFCS